MKNKQPIATINGQEIPGWLYGKLRNRYGEDKACEILFKARKAQNIVKYCQAGMAAGWLAEMTTEQEREKPKMLAWIAQNVKRKAPDKKPMIPKKKKVYKEGKLIGHDGGRTAEPDKLSEVLKGIV